MKILFFSHYFPPEVNAPAVRTYEHCREWVESGHEVHVITCVPNHPQGEVYPGYDTSFTPQHEEVDGIHVHRVWNYIAPNKGFVGRILNYFTYMLTAPLAALGLPRPDVVVATSPQFFCACAGFLGSKLRHAPWIFELRDIWPESIVAVGAIENPWIIGALETVELFLYRDAARVVSLTGAFRENLIGRGIDGDKIHVVTNGIDASSWSPGDRKEAREKLGLDAEGTVVSYVGTHGMAHNLETMLEAADILRGREDIRFITVGDGAEFDNLQRMRAGMELDSVSMLGQVPREEARLYLQASDASLVLLRDSDLFRTVIPSKIFEAMAVGNPIILGVGGEARDIVEGEEAGIAIPPESPQDLADAVCYLADNDDARTRMGRAGQRAVAEKYDRKELAAEMLEVMQTATE